MNKTKIYNAVIESFENKFSWLGKQFAQEFLCAVASYNLEENLKFDARIRNHILLFWQHGWLKSSLIYRAFDILGNDNAAYITDISEPALRGSVEFTSDGESQYVPPFVKEKPFIIVSEIGSLTHKYRSDSLVQEMLTILEEGFNSTQLIKIARLSPEQRAKAEEEYGVRFEGLSRVYFKTNCVWIGATYNADYIVDNAFASRWEIQRPNQELTSKLTKWINRHSWHIDEDVVENLRKLIGDKPDPNLKAYFNKYLPDEMYDKYPQLSPRMSRSLKVYRLCRAYWGLKTDDDMLVNRLDNIIVSQDSVSEGWIDKVLEYLRKNGKCTYNDIKDGVKIPSAILFNVLKHSDVSRIKKKNKTYYYMNE